MEETDDRASQNTLGSEANPPLTCAPAGPAILSCRAQPLITPPRRVRAPIAERSVVVLDRVAHRLCQRSRISHEREQLFARLLGHRQVGRVRRRH